MYNIYFNCLLTICILYDIIYVKKDNLKHARTCMYNINYHIVCSVKCRRKMYEKFPDLRQQLWKGGAMPKARKKKNSSFQTTIK